MEIPENVMLVNKPIGITSFDVIRNLRKKLGVKKIGHAGTLDPRASGLMIIGIGAGTKQLTELTQLDKEYVAEIRVGERRTTGDLDGDVIETKAVEGLSDAQIKATLATMVGVLTLSVSAYSAIKKDGVPMYKRARAAAKRGETVNDVPVRDMHVYEVEFLSSDTLMIDGVSMCVVTARFEVGSGTYIRSLAEEFGARLGYPATLQALHRTKVGEFRIEDAEAL